MVVGRKGTRNEFNQIMGHDRYTKDQSLYWLVGNTYGWYITKIVLCKNCNPTRCPNVQTGHATKGQDCHASSRRRVPKLNVVGTCSCSKQIIQAYVALRGGSVPDFAGGLR